MNHELMVAIAISVFVISVSACLVLLWNLTKCIHAWELVDKTELPSGFENMAKVGIQPQSLSGWYISELSKKTVIIAMRCPKCGAARIYKETA